MAEAIRDQNHVTAMLFKGSDGLTYNATGDEVTGRLKVDISGGGSGTVTSVSVVTANGFAGTVANATTTPAITVTTTITGILEGNGTAISAASTTGTGSVVLSNSPVFNDDITLGVAATATGSILFKGVTSGTVTLSVADAAGTWTMKLPANDGESGQVLGTDGSGNTSWVSAGGVPTTITVANEATDTTCFIGFFTAATGDLGPKTNANLTFNSNTGVLTLVAPILGTPTSVTLTNATGLPVSTGIAGLGTGVATALAVNVGTAGAFVVNGGALGTPSSGTVTNLTGTASININGTVGATTPTTGVFTTATVNTGLLPDANDGAYLGQAGTAFSDLFLAEGAVINWDSGDATITQTGNVLAIAGADLRVATADVGTNADSVPTLSSTSTLTNKTLTTPTVTTANLSGAQQLAEGASIRQDAALSADGTYSGITKAGTAGATLAFGDLVYLAAADSRWELTDADAASTSGSVQIGICVLAAASDGDPTVILLQGNIRADTAFPSMTISAPMYVSTTAGDITGTAPNATDDVVRVVGFANTADELEFNPSPDYITIV